MLTANALAVRLRSMEGMNMTEFEYVLACLMIPVSYVLIYIAGKYDFLNLVCRMLEEKAKELNRSDDHEQT